MLTAASPPRLPHLNYSLSSIQFPSSPSVRTRTWHFRSYPPLSSSCVFCRWKEKRLGWSRDSLVWQVMHGLPWWELVCLNFVGFFPIILQTISLILQMPVNAKQTWIFFFIVLVIGVQHILQDCFSLLVPISNILLDNLERRRITHQQFSMSLGLQNSSARKRRNTRRLWEVFLHTQEIKEQSVKEATLVSVEYMGQWLICQSCNHSLAYQNKQRGQSSEQIHIYLEDVVEGLVEIGEMDKKGGKFDQILNNCSLFFLIISMTNFILL